MVIKSTNSPKCIKVFYIIVFLLHVSVTLVTIVWEVHYKGWIYQDITDDCETVRRCKIISFKNTWFKYTLKYK